MEYIHDLHAKTTWMQRLSKTQTLKDKYPTRVPVLIDRADKNTPKPDNHKYLVPSDLTVGQFQYVMKQHIPDLKPEQAIFLFVGDGKVIPPNNALMSQIFAEYHSRDNYLIILYQIESTFG